MKLKLSKINKEKKQCQCDEIILCPAEWIYTECPFTIKQQKAFQKQEPMSFYKIISCSCGKQIGEIQFSGLQAGKWRIFQQKLIVEQKLTKFKQYMSTGFFKSLHPLLETMAKIQKSIAFTSQMYDKIA